MRAVEGRGGDSLAIAARTKLALVIRCQRARSGDATLALPSGRPRRGDRRRRAAPQFEFLAAPQINLSLVYRLDKLTGDVIACQYAHNPGKTDIEPGAFGVTVCYRSGDGATKQEPGDYGLIATRHEQEGGVFRVDYRTGALSICYLYFQREKQGDRDVITDQYVVCTPPYKGP